MNINETEDKEDNREEKRKSHFEWFKEHLQSLTRDVKEQSRKARFWLEVLALLGLGIYTTVAALQLGTTRDTLKELQIQFRASERPYVGLGNHEGKIAEFVPQPDIRGAHWVVLHFFNSGHAPALNFNVRYWTTYNTVFPQPQWPQVQRFRNEVTGKIQVMGGGTTIPGQSEYVFYVGPQGLPSKEQLERLRSTGEQFYVMGTFDYCDQFGKFHCDGYAATYLGQFNAWILNTGPQCLPPLRETKNTITSPGRTTPDPLTPLCPCAQPGQERDN